MAAKQSWKSHVSLYRQQTALKFRKQEFVRALQLLDTDQFFDLPFALVGNETLIVPTAAITYFRNHGLIFTEQPVKLPDEELSPQELAARKNELTACSGFATM